MTPTAIPSPSLAALLRDTRPDAEAGAEHGRLLRQALWPLLAALALVLGWSAAAPLAGAVVAPAEVKVELNRKTVQHAEGGTVQQILVRDGQAVHAGDALLVIGDLIGQAELALLEDQWRMARLRAARAEAESRSAASFEPPADLAHDAAAAEHLARERAVFAAHRQAIDEQVVLLRDQAVQALGQANALETQIEATQRSAALSDEELAMNEKLVAEGFVNRTRLLALQRASADYASRIGQTRSDLASARQRAGELRTRIAQLRLQQQTQATDELRDATAQVRELAEKLRPQHDRVERQTVRAPVDGTVMALHVAAPGAVVAAREPLLDVVPAREKLVVDGRVATQDIEHVQPGGTAEVRLLGSGARRRAPLPGHVVFVSPDRVSDGASGRSWFVVTVEVDRDALGALQPALVLQPGMPAELYLTTAERTLVQYLLKPLGLFTQRALREP